MTNTAVSVDDHSKSANAATRDLSPEPTREEKTLEAIAEGHDADIPSNIGYVLNEDGERQRRASIHRTRSQSVTDPEKGHQTEPEFSGVEGDTEDDDENVVWWDSDDDVHNPYNWSRWRKVSNCVLISALTFVTPLASCMRIILLPAHTDKKLIASLAMFAPGVPDLMVEFQSKSSELGSFCVSVYVLGFAAGPLLFAPLSEIYGRLIVYHCCNIGFIGKL